MCKIIFSVYTVKQRLFANFFLEIKKLNIIILREYSTYIKSVRITFDTWPVASSVMKSSTLITYLVVYTFFSPFIVTFHIQY